jgi:hypothetical protein
MSEKSNFAVDILKRYAKENQIQARSTSDLSPLEQWLMLYIFNINKKELLIDFLNWLNDVWGHDPMMVETDNDDIAEMYLNYKNIKQNEEI